MRGTYVLPNKEPKEGERKLYLAIEATSEMAIQKAKKEITRLIKEELVRLVSCTAGASLGLVGLVVVWELVALKILKPEKGVNYFILGQCFYEVLSTQIIHFSKPKT